MPAIRVGVSSRMSNARPAPWAPGMKAGTIADRQGDHDEHQRTAPRRQVAATYGLLAEAEEDRDVDDGAAGRGEAAGSDVRRVRVSRGERGRHVPPPRRPSRRRRPRRPASPPRSTSAVAAGLDGEVAQVGGEQDRGAARAGVGDHVEGRLDADRVDAVERLVEQQHAGARASRPARPRAAGPCRGEKPPVTRCATSPSSKRSSRSRARSSQSVSRRSRALSWRCSHGRGARHQAADVGAVAGELLDGRAVSVRMSRPATSTRARGRRHDAGQHPHGGRLAGAVAPEQRGRLAGVRLRGRCRRTASTSPKRTCRPRTSTTGG